MRHVAEKYLPSWPVWVNVYENPVFGRIYGVWHRSRADAGDAAELRIRRYQETGPLYRIKVIPK